MKFLRLLAVVLLSIDIAAYAADGKDEVVVAAAADLQFVMPDLARQFEKETGNKVKATFGSSGNFASQIQNGAPFDLFFSADLNYPEQLDAVGLIEPGSVYHYANGKIVLWTLKTSNLDTSRGLELLMDQKVSKISLANPAHAPYGRAAVAALQHENIYDKVREKIVLAENISQAAQFVDSGNAEVGIVALSLVLAPSVSGKGDYYVIPQTYYPAIEQGCAMLKSSQHKKAAQQFLDFIKKPQTIALLKQFGFEQFKPQ
jgi:molybdate transport system substrate-binding protein